MKQWAPPVLRILNALSAAKRGEEAPLEDLVKAYRTYHQNESKAFSKKEERSENEESLESFRGLLENRESCIAALESGSIIDADQLFMLEDEITTHRGKPNPTSAGFFNETIRKNIEQFDSFLGELSKGGFSSEQFIGTREESLIETFRGIYSGTEPELSVINISYFLGNSPLVSTYEDIFTELESFLSTGDKAYLLNACERYISTLPKQNSRSGPESSGVLCINCCASNDATRLTCVNCGARLMFRDSIIQSTQFSEDESVPENITGLPLPPVAEPLVSLLTQVEKGTYSEGDVYLTLDRLDIALNQAHQNLEQDRTIPEMQRESMRAALDQFFQAREEAGRFLESYDVTALRKAIKIFSDASIKAKKATESADADLI